MSTRTFASPLFDAVHAGEETERSSVDHTPISVARITSLRLSGLNNAQRTGISGRSPSLLTHVKPASTEYQIDVTPKFENITRISLSDAPSSTQDIQAVGKLVPVISVEDGLEELALLIF